MGFEKIFNKENARIAAIVFLLLVVCVLVIVFLFF